MMETGKRNEKNQGIREKLERAWQVKAAVVPLVSGTLGPVTPMLEKCL